MSSSSLMRTDPSLLFIPQVLSLRERTQQVLRTLPLNLMEYKRDSTNKSSLDGSTRRTPAITGRSNSSLVLVQLSMENLFSTAFTTLTHSEKRWLTTGQRSSMNRCTLSAKIIQLQSLKYFRQPLQSRDLNLQRVLQSLLQELHIPRVLLRSLTLRTWLEQPSVIPSQLVPIVLTSNLVLKYFLVISHPPHQFRKQKLLESPSFASPARTALMQPKQYFLIS